MNNYVSILGSALVIGATSCNFQSPGTGQGEANQPNIIIILLDDAGYADFGFVGSEDLKTPNIDRLAANSVVFTDAHVSATVCGPSRAGLITGRYQQRFGFECNPDAEFEGMDNSERTIADAMKLAGYHTSAFGKWHLGELPEFRPNQRGFDYFWGFLSGGRNYFHNPSDDQPGGVRSIRENDVFTTFDGYLTDVLGDKLIDYIEAHKDNPFFVYWSPNAPHTPMQATEEDLALFEGHPRQILAAMMWSLDRTVGHITDKLEQEGLLDNTLIFFLSDNGGAHNNQSSNEPLKGWKGNKYEGGCRVPFFVHWPASFQGGRRFDGLTSALDIFATSIDAAGLHSDDLPHRLDGVSLLPYLKGEKQGSPHDQLFFRKDQMASIRQGDHKMIRVEGLGVRLYNLRENLAETIDLTSEKPELLESLNIALEKWESEMMEPLWIEEEAWNEVTWMIHEDLFLNREPRAKNPDQLNSYRRNR